MTSDAFEARLNAGDLTLFSAIEGYSSPGDRRAWLGLQRIARREQGAYAYLEIGSDRGGSIQPYLMDPACRRVYSIDLRPALSPDDRGFVMDYGENTEERMLDNLRAVCPTELSKVACFKKDARDIDTRLIDEAPTLCFIDGEHTRDAVLSDFAFCRRIVPSDAIIYLHDADTIYSAIAEILGDLRKSGESFSAVKLEGQTFAIFFGKLQAFCAEVSGISFTLYSMDRRLRSALRESLPGPLLNAARKLRYKYLG